MSQGNKQAEIYGISCPNHILIIEDWQAKCSRGNSAPVVPNGSFPARDREGGSLKKWSQFRWSGVYPFLILGTTGRSSQLLTFRGSLSEGEHI